MVFAPMTLNRLQRLMVGRKTSIQTNTLSQLDQQQFYDFQKLTIVEVLEFELFEFRAFNPPLPMWLSGTYSSEQNHLSPFCGKKENQNNETKVEETEMLM